MPALFKSIGTWRRSDGIADTGFGEPDRIRDGCGRVEKPQQADDTHDLSFRSAALIRQVRQQDGVLFVGI